MPRTTAIWTSWPRMGNSRAIGAIPGPNEVIGGLAEFFGLRVGFHQPRLYISNILESWLFIAPQHIINSFIIAI